MAEKGVGRGLLKLIKSRQQSTSQDPSEQAVPGPSTSAQAAEPVTPLTPSAPETLGAGSLPRRVKLNLVYFGSLGCILMVNFLPFKQTMGRGLALARKTTDTSNPPPLDREPLQDVQQPSAAAAQQQQQQREREREQFQSVETTQRAPSQSRLPPSLPPASATAQRGEPPAPLDSSSKPAPRGRGMLIRGVRKSVSEDVDSPTQPSPPPITSSRLTTEPVSAPAPQPAKPSSAFAAPPSQVDQQATRLA